MGTINNTIAWNDNISLDKSLSSTKTLSFLSYLDKIAYLRGRNIVVVQAEGKKLEFKEPKGPGSKWWSVLHAVKWLALLIIIPLLARGLSHYLRKRYRFTCQTITPRLKLPLEPKPGITLDKKNLDQKSFTISNSLEHTLPKENAISDVDTTLSPFEPRSDIDSKFIKIKEEPLSGLSGNPQASTYLSEQTESTAPLIPSIRSKRPSFSSKTANGLWASLNTPVPRGCLHRTYELELNKTPLH